MYFPNRDELSFRTVFALPKAKERPAGPFDHRFRFTFQNRIGVENLLFDPRVLAAGRGEKLQNQLRRFGFATSTLATDDDALIVLVTFHTPESVVADGEDMRR